MFADRPAGLLFAGDHVLPTITPSIGFEPRARRSAPARLPRRRSPRCADCPTCACCPRTGRWRRRRTTRVDQLLAHHEVRLDRCLHAIRKRPGTGYDVAGELPWTRHEHSLAELDVFNAALASMETKAHLELLVARGQATREVTPDGVVFSAA